METNVFNLFIMWDHSTAAGACLEANELNCFMRKGHGPEAAALLGGMPRELVRRLYYAVATSLS